MRSNSIPLHRLQTGKKPAAFEIQYWSNDPSRYDASLPHRHNYFEVLVFLKGGGLHEIDFQKYKNASHSLHFVAANQVHQVTRSPLSSGFSILFTPEFLPASFNIAQLEYYQLGTQPVLNLSSRFKLLKPLMNELLEEYKVNRNRELLQSLLQAFLIKTESLYGEANPGTAAWGEKKQKFKTEFLDLIDVHLRHHWRAGDYATAMKTSTPGLNAWCKKHFSAGTESLIRERLIIEIKRMLVYTPKSAKEICYELNFEDPAYFNRFFKKNTGLTPVEYRRAVNT